MHGLGMISLRCETLQGILESVNSSTVKSSIMKPGVKPKMQMGWRPGGS
jgi:hypothetical protein